jgi:GxxExxY protein
LDREERKVRQEPTAQVETVARSVVDAGLKVHKALGPGLLESAYEHCLAYELTSRGIPLLRQVPLPIVYEGARVDAGYRLDMIVANCIIIEVKAIDQLTRLHEAQLLTYLRLSGLRLGFLMNFNVELFRTGVRRLVLSS